MNAMRLLLVVAFVGTCASLSAQKKNAPAPYFPSATQWQTKTPAQVGMDAGKLALAIAFAKEKETKSARNLEVTHYQTFGKEPFGDAIGPFKERGEPTGVVIRNGYIVAEWGEPLRVDMTFSVTKSFLSSVVGVAYDKGLIPNIYDSVYKAMAPVNVYNAMPTGNNKADHFGEPTLINLFDTPHNRTITWNDLLRQTSDWEGTLWGKPEWADRPGPNAAEWTTRPRVKPGEVYEYNDVRVNVLALAALNIWRKPLPQVLKENIMDPIGASASWRWMGYDNSWVVLDGQLIQAVGGGGHWGGGMFITARDMARFGYLTLRRGKWNNTQLLSEQWVKWSLTPTPAQPTYGFMNWFVNTDKKYLPSAPATAFAHIGNGTNMIYVDYENDLVVVARWIDNSSLDGFVQRVLEAIEK
ncbi:serine hydrolase domain-containing protein [Chryseolinea lacunae]|uniref:Serine hydrolase n=1 Tax=Chryseolinea lacunae TaxID=2801331 RepID=A0ABS1KQU5_9BACT|nr:serine hydrolase [Chryseolinea lacunae]MBL0741840.1 serine hydrolase [Chryseolinea lacunae]